MIFAPCDAIQLMKLSLEPKDMSRKLDSGVGVFWFSNNFYIFNEDDLKYHHPYFPSGAYSSGCLRSLTYWGSAGCLQEAINNTSLLSLCIIMRMPIENVSRATAFLW